MPRSVENHAHPVALFTTYYKFVRHHKTLRVTPAIAGGVSDRLWEVGDIVALTEPGRGRDADEARSLQEAGNVSRFVTPGGQC